VPIVLKSGSLNLLEPPGLVQVCNGIALPCITFNHKTTRRHKTEVNLFRISEYESNRLLSHVNLSLAPNAMCISKSVPNEYEFPSLIACSQHLSTKKE